MKLALLALTALTTTTPVLAAEHDHHMTQATSAPAALRPGKPQLRILGAWSRPTPPGAPTGVGYLTAVNSGVGDDRLVGATSALARSVEIHEMSMAGGVMRMRPAPNGMIIPAGGRAALGPGGYHLMLIGPTRPYKLGDRIPVTLRFEKSGAVKIDLVVVVESPK